MHRTVPPTKKCLAQNINKAEFEQHRSNKKQQMQGSSQRENVQGLADVGTAEGEEPQAPGRVGIVMPGRKWSGGENECRREGSQGANSYPHHLSTGITDEFDSVAQG